MKNILVTGANGQLGKCLLDLSPNISNFHFVFADKELLDLGDPANIESFFTSRHFDYCINAAAYTNVEKAESESDLAFRVNAEGVKHLAQQCARHDTVLIHVSTDYVFDGLKTTPYKENDPVAPLNQYGASKLQGEAYIQQICHKYFILRTSWLYSQYGHNFLKSILKFAEEKKDLKITTEQIGTPTNANDLAGAILHIITTDNRNYGLYHFSNDGNATWYDFAKEILRQTQRLEEVKLVETDYYPTFAKRPRYSVLSKENFLRSFDYPIVPWEKALTSVIKKLY
jgi:dTDP-4-dehydrorhamnose reductase